MTDLELTLDAKLGAVLDRWPELLGTLVELSPRFRALEQPLLRKTLGRVATLRQVATAGGVGPETLLARFRAASGLPPLAAPPAVETPPAGRPAWAHPAAVAARRDARVDVEAGAHPLPHVLQDLAALGDGEVYELLTPFIPAPLLDLAARDGYESYPELDPDAPFVRTLFRRRPGARGAP